MKAPEGYRMLKVGEAILSSDLVHDNVSGWQHTICAGSEVTGACAYCRKFDAEVQIADNDYRYLQLGEEIKDGDEVCRDNGAWERTICGDGDFYVEADDIDRYRRLNERDGHRALKKGEKIQEGDKYWDPFSKWVAVPEQYYGDLAISISVKRPIERKFAFNEMRGYPSRLTIVDGELQMIDKTCDLREYLREFQRKAGVKDGEEMLLVRRDQAQHNVARFRELRKELEFARALQWVG